MGVKRTPYAYRAGNSFLHKAPAPLKMLFLLCFSASSFVISQIPVAACKAALYFFFLLALSIFAAVLRMRPWELFRGSRALCVLCAPVIIMRSVDFFPLSFSFSGLIQALSFCLTLFLSFAFGSVFFSCTTMHELKKSMPAVLGLSLSLMLGFIPRFFVIWEDAECAWLARGGKKSIKGFALLLPIAIERMIESAGNTAAALRARGL